MDEDIVVDGDKFDAVLRRMLETKPISKAEISAKIKAERRAKQQADSVQKLDTNECARFRSLPREKR